MNKAERLCLKSSTVQDLIHTGLEPGDRWLEEIREPFQRFRLLPGPLSFQHEAASVTAQTEKPLKRFLDQSLGLGHRAEARFE